MSIKTIEATQKISYIHMTMENIPEIIDSLRGGDPKLRYSFLESSGEVSGKFLVIHNEDVLNHFREERLGLPDDSRYAMDRSKWLALGAGYVLITETNTALSLFKGRVYRSEILEELGFTLDFTDEEEKNDV